MGNEVSHKLSPANSNNSSVEDTISTSFSRIEPNYDNKSPKSPKSPTDALQSSNMNLAAIDDSAAMPPDLPPLSPSITNRSMSSINAANKSKSALRKRKSHHRRKSSLLIVHNGITGKYISSRICKIVAKFWQQEIENLSLSEQLEIGCSIFFSMLAANPLMKKVMKQNFDEKNKIENTCLRYLDMMGWLTRYLVTDNIDLYALLSKLGTFHQKMGIKINHFTPMLGAMHETFSYYFETKYNIEIKYAMEEIFSIAAQIMTGQDLKCNPSLMNIEQQFSTNDIPFLKSLNVCLTSNIGTQYLNRYLAQTWCDEIAIFLKAVLRFKHLTCDKERFMVAREITKISIQPSATFALNLSYETRQTALFEMNQLEAMFTAKKPFKVGSDFFMQSEKEIHKLIMDNHWKKFTDSIEILHSKSFNVE